MKTKTLITLLIVLVMSMTLCITTYASISAGDNSGAIEETSTEKTVNGNPKEFTFTPASGEKIPLTLKESFNTADFQRDVYYDSEKNEYYVDLTCDVVGYGKQNAYKDVPDIDEDDHEYFTCAIKEDEAIKIAEEHCKLFYGDAFDNFKFHYCENDEIEYTIEYFITFGEDNFLLGATCRVYVLYDGTVITSSMINQKEIADFDPALLDGITIEKIEEIAEEKAKAAYMDDFISSEIRNVKIIKTDGKYSLQIATAVSFLFDVDGTKVNGSNLEAYYYGLS